MVRQQKCQELQKLTVPSFFRCPISMDVMKSPVSLCTGVTYDRSSIQEWLDTGHNTCPATAQILPSTDFVPNLTLRRLIDLWIDSAPLAPVFAISKQQALDSLKKLETTNTCSEQHLSRVAEFAKYSKENLRFLIKNDAFFPTLVRLLDSANEIEVLEVTVTVLDMVVKESSMSVSFVTLTDKLLSGFTKIFEKGSLNSRIKAARILEAVASSDTESRRRIGENLLEEFFLLASSHTDTAAVEVGLSCLVAVSSFRQVQKELVRLGIVRAGREILSRQDTTKVVIVEKTMKLLEMVSKCTEGRAAIGGDKGLVGEVVGRLMKGSRAATESGVAVLWSVCYLSRDVAAAEAAAKGNGLAKALLVMQSDCGPGARKMCGDLMKVFRVNSKSCLASYETQTTHIMPY